MQPTLVEHIIGYPAPLLGSESYRLKVIEIGEGIYLHEKPPGVLVDPHPWYPQVPSITQALRLQLMQSKPELTESSMDLRNPKSVHSLDRDASGGVLIAGNTKSSALLRNIHGSSQLCLRFLLIATGKNDMPESFECNLPLAACEGEPRMTVSHKSGRKSSTQFKHLETFGQYQLWQADVRYYRLHQVRVHALESGLNILGEKRYTDVPIPLLSDLKRNYKGKKNEEPLYSSLCLHLSQIYLPNLENPREEGTWHVPFPMPPKMEVLIERLKGCC